MNQLIPATALNHQSLMDLFDSVNTAQNYRCLGSPGLVIGTSSTAAVKIANTTPYLWGGQFKSKTTAEIAFTATVDDIPSNASSAQERLYVLGLDAAGNGKLIGGAIASTAGGALYPEPSAYAGYTPIGAVRVLCASGTGFVAGTTALSAAGITATYYNIGFLSPRFDSAQ